MNYKVGIFPEYLFLFFHFITIFFSFSDSTQQRDYRHTTENDQQIQPITSHKREIKKLYFVYFTDFPLIFLCMKWKFCVHHYTFFFGVYIESCASEAGNINLYICFALYTPLHASLMSHSFIQIIFFKSGVNSRFAMKDYYFKSMSDSWVWGIFF